MPVARKLDVYLVPALVEADDLQGRVVIVIDVLRATTTMVHALAAGAREVVPCLEVEEARRLAAELVPAVLGGERGGQQIPGFDLGNSPAEYTPERVGGKIVVFTTTNGTRALLRCRGAARVLLAAFVNFSAVCREAVQARELVVLCAGTDGEVTREDALLAGAIVDDVMRSTSGQPLALNDQAELAADAWRCAVRGLTDRPLGVVLRSSQGARNLIEIGQESDIDLAAQIDKFDLVPELDLASWRVRCA
jgi:2-phosphosulfolactate phosphatase